VHDELKEGMTVTRIERTSFGKVKATASIRIGVLEIHGLRVIAKDDNSLWVALPKKKKGEGEYASIVEAHDRRMMKAISATVLETYGKDGPAKATAEQTVAMLNLESPATYKKKPARKREDKQQAIIPFHDDPILI
jgi:DNA-binding cell septation regulator SpoVG